MLISHYLESVRGDLERLGALAGEEFEGFASRLAEAAAPALRTRLLEALDAIISEANVDHDRQDLGLGLAGDEVSIVRSDPDPSPETPGDFSARFALRLPEDVKSRIEQLAQQAGTSTNGWIVRALAREATESATRGSQRPGRQLRGTGRS